jgi:RNA polymerase-binding transcription factor DksA
MYNQKEIIYTYFHPLADQQFLLCEQCGEKVDLKQLLVQQIKPGQWLHYKQQI